MLLELMVQDFALIDKLRIEFSQGLNILSGETGAGKSIIIDSVNFVLGDRSSKEVIRTGADKTNVQAIFEYIGDSKLDELMNGCGIEIEKDIIILSRELNLSGRSICRVNGTAVTTSVLRIIGEFLIDIHGQHEHQSLLNEENHIDILDMFGGNELNLLKIEFKEIFAEVQEMKTHLKSIMGDDLERERKLSLLNYQIDEIDGSKLKINEEEELIKQKTLLNNAGRIFSVLTSSYSNLYDGEDGNQSIFDRLGFVISELRSISNIDEKINSIYKCIEEAYYNIESSVEDIRLYKDKMDFNPELINDIELRLDVISKLKRKYGKTIKDVLDYREQIFIEKLDIENSEEIIEDLKREIKDKVEIQSRTCASLSQRRKLIAKNLESNIMNELKFLGMEKPKFEVCFENYSKDDVSACYEKGCDIVRFLISTNPGEPVKPLSKVASGGEISRIMLAIKTVLADTDRIPSLIFDEIDTGISGRAAQAVAEKLGQISGSHQVICVTHLPQIASMADTHFYISKEAASGKTVTSIKKLDDNSRINEVARMLGGAQLTDLTIKHAEEMTLMAQKTKTNQKLKTVK